MPTTVISTRLDPNMVAKARDGLKAKGYDADQLATVSNIVRLTFFYGLSELLADSDCQISEESRIWVNQKIRQTQRKATFSLGDLKK